MESITISQISRMFSISTRTLRYYEQIGLLPSHRVDDYAYRMYDENSVSRLQQIILLRKLRIPLKEISRIFANPDTTAILEVFLQSVRELNDEITALTTIQLIISRFISELQSCAEMSLNTVLFSNEAVLNAINSLSLTKINFREEKSMNDLNRAHEELSKLKNVRIIRLPPFAVASYHYVGENPEEKVGDVVSKALKDIALYEIKPDARMFGFNHPSPSEGSEHHGYEDRVTVPDDLDVPAPMVKKHFKGGMYAVHTITMPNFHEWSDLSNWVENSDIYEADYAPEGSEIMSGCLEEHLNWVYNNHLDWPESLNESQLDLYLPVKLKTARQ